MTQPANDADRRSTITEELIRDLWHFIENVTEDDPERTDKFFALRERVRNHYPEPIATGSRSR